MAENVHWKENSFLCVKFNSGCEKQKLCANDAHITYFFPGIGTLVLNGKKTVSFGHSSNPDPRPIQWFKQLMIN